MIKLQTAHVWGSTSSAVTLRRRQIMLQHRVVESQRCLSAPTHVHLQPNYYRPRRGRARRQILNSPMPTLTREQALLWVRDCRYARAPSHQVLSDTATKFNMAPDKEWNLIYIFL